MKRTPANWFLAAALLFLLAGMFFGVLAGAQYVLPGLWRDSLPFVRLRPLHVSLVVFWLLLGAAGCVYYFLGTEKLLKTRHNKWVYLHFGLAVFVVLGGVISYVTGTFGGREYWEFPPFLAFPLIVGWLVFLVVYVLAVFRKVSSWPVYYWMWLTGIGFFILSLTESYLWLLPYFRDNLIRDMTVQWKSYGAIVGSWNQLIYGAAFFLMVKISGDNTFAFSRKTYFFYFLGLFNLLFNWGHHIYTLPVSSYIKHTAYLVSMTELLIFGKIVWEWKNSLSEIRKFSHIFSYRFLAAADVWVLINLGVAILMSVPALNLHTHGTHVTVAHAMGTTIGINTMILLAAAFYIFQQKFGAFSIKKLRVATVGFWLSNGSLLVFWMALMGAGLTTAWLHFTDPKLSYAILMQTLLPYFACFMLGGVSLFIGLFLVVSPLLHQFIYPVYPVGKSMKTTFENTSELKTKIDYANEYAS